MEDREFFDTLYQLWVKTTGASERFWDVQRTITGFEVGSVSAAEDRGKVAEFLTEGDADWVTAVHGCFPDLCRRLHAALDEADRLDREMDEVQSRLAAAELRIVELQA